MDDGLKKSYQKIMAPADLKKKVMDSGEKANRWRKLSISRTPTLAACACFMIITFVFFGVLNKGHVTNPEIITIAFTQNTNPKVRLANQTVGEAVKIEYKIDDRAVIDVTDGSIVLDTVNGKELMSLPFEGIDLESFYYILPDKDEFDEIITITSSTKNIEIVVKKTNKKVTMSINEKEN